MNDTTMTHGADCSRPQPTSKRVNAGWMRLRCPECGHVGSAAAPAPVRNLTPVAGSGYVCRDHHDQPVTWRGRGCPICAADQKRRSAPEPSDDYERNRR